MLSYVTMPGNVEDIGLSRDISYSSPQYHASRFLVPVTLDAAMWYIATNLLSTSFISQKQIRDNTTYSTYTVRVLSLS